MKPEQLAALHKQCFTIPRPWSATEFAALLATPGCFLLTHIHGFLLGRAVAGEAELLTVAVDPRARRQGTGRTLTQDFAGEARLRSAREAFLEVASDNLPAQALYHGLGWQLAGRRPGYYAPGLDAIVMRLDLPEQAISPGTRNLTSNQTEGS